MPEKPTHQDVYSGNELKVAVQGRVRGGVTRATQMARPHMSSLMEAIDANFDDFCQYMDWSQPRRWGEIQPVIGCINSALQYTVLKTGGDLTELYNIIEPVVWWDVVTTTLNNLEKQRIFKENCWRSPMVVAPRRALPLLYILNYHFGERELVGTDLGAGLHVGVPSLNSEEFLNAEFPGRGEIAHLARPLNWQLALGVDKQPRDIDWTIASYWPSFENIESTARLRRHYQRAVSQEARYPFFQCNIFDTYSIQREIERRTLNDGKADFVFTSFVRQQLGDSSLIQERLKQSIAGMLHAGGIWVDIGEELLERDRTDFTSYKVRVWERINSSKLEQVGVPFTFTNSSQSDIGITNIEYFR